MKAGREPESKGDAVSAGGGERKGGGGGWWEGRGELGGGGGGGEGWQENCVAANTSLT